MNIQNYDRAVVIEKLKALHLARQNEINEIMRGMAASHQLAVYEEGLKDGYALAKAEAEAKS